MKYIVMLIGLLGSVPAFAQVCNDAIAQNAFIARYQISTDPSVVLDQATGLEWQRCAAGYVFNDQGDSADITAHTCDVPAENTDDDANTSVQVAWNWNQAIERAAQEGGGWRLPNYKELTSLIEFACHTPAINADAFPNVQQAGHWASTPNASTDSSGWSINFSDGADTVSDKTSALAIRLVRD